MNIKKRLPLFRLVIVMGWTVFVCLYYGYAYLESLHDAYPILQQVRELGIFELLKRYFMP